MPERLSCLPSEIDLDTPSAVRVHDFYLGGNNFACDRELGKKVLAIAPEVRAAALANRAFLRRVIQLCTENGIRQFLDLGSGVPTSGNTQEIARQLAPGSIVVYVDHDPVAVARSELLLEGVPGTGIVHADARNTDKVLTTDETQQLFSFTEPICVLMLALPLFIPDSDHPAEVIARYRDAIAPGSYFALSHLTGDNLPAEMDAVMRLYRESHNPGTLRIRQQLTQLFAGFDIMEPGVVFLSQWRPETPADAATARRSVCYAGVARKL